MATNTLLVQKIGKSFSYIAIATLVAISSLFALPISVSASGALAFAGGSTINGLTDVYVPVTGLTLTGTSADPAIPVSLSVPRGQLSMTTTIGLTFTGSPTGSNLAFSGSQADINAALATLRYRTTRAETVQLTATLTSPGVVYFPGNGHMYEVINHGSGISWDDAKIAAEGLTKNGAQGYLATITSQAENDYLLGKLIGDGWFGASDAQTEDDWKWVTGPETGTSFWQGLGDGSPVGGLFSNWASGEPNNAGNEDCAQFYSSGSGWNDLPCDGPYLNYYVVEYGTDGALPVAPSSTTSTITTSFPTPNDIDISSCLDLIDVADNAGDHRYDNLSLTGNIDCNGEVLAPMFSETDPDLGTMGFRGTFDGNGHTISNATVQRLDSGSAGFFAATDGATIKDVTLTGEVSGIAECTGGLVGDALNTVFDTVSVNAAVSGNDKIGGIIGCLKADHSTSSLTDSTALGTVHGDTRAGGAIGNVYALDEGVITITDNTASSTVTTMNGNSAGGLVGEVTGSDNGSSLTFTSNTTMGVSANNTYKVGGLLGAFYIEDGATSSVSANTIGGDVAASEAAGGLIGDLSVNNGAQLTISNSHITHNVEALNGYAGGLVGNAYAEGNSTNTKIHVSNSSNSGSVGGDYAVGGLFGMLVGDYGNEDLQILNSHTTGNVTSNGDETGGIAGYTYGAVLESTYATGDVVAGGTSGGLVGESYSTDILTSYATGDITSSDDGVGGLTGRNGDDSRIIESYATGTVEGVSRVGGISGANGEGALILNSYARGTVTGQNNVGGVAGRCGYGAIEKSYATGAVMGGSDTGGILGRNAGSCTIEDSFWDTDTTAQATSAVGGTGKTTAQMKSKSTFTTVAAGLVESWDFTDVWGLTSSVNNGYACLLWQANDCGTSQDSDNVSNAMEDDAPNNGDANNDGTADSEQSNVASFVNSVTQDYISLEVDQACDLSSVGSATESSHAKSDTAYTYQNGFVGFTANCGTPGYTSTITQYYYGAQLSPGMVLRKYNPTTQTYFTVEDATLSSVTVGGRSAVMVVYTITDGGNLDVDGVQNGVIVDPVGIATLTGAGELASTGEQGGILVNAAVVLVSVAGLALGGLFAVSIRQKRRLLRR